jgi:xanthine dehydrogenase accessory factor
MVRVMPSEEGSVTVQNPCLSGGAIEVFLEPVLPPPPRRRRR